MTTPRRRNTPRPVRGGEAPRRTDGGDAPRPTDGGGHPGPAGGAPLRPPKGGATVRMYRIGHGDCFLLAFATADEGAPVHVLIDCGYKPGSQPHAADGLVGHLHASCEGRLDVAVITHEHQDHVNGITRARFGGFHVGETWMAWTEDPGDPVATGLRARFRRRLSGLVAARHRLAAAGDTRTTEEIDRLLQLELGGEEAELDAAAMGLGPGGGNHVHGAAGAAGANAPPASANRRAMMLLQELARDGVRYLRPHETALLLPGTDVRVFVLGPPRDPARLADLDPRADEEFHLGGARYGTDFAAAALAEEGRGVSPFTAPYTVPLAAAATDAADGAFFTARYGTGNGTPAGSRGDEVPDDAPWRRIDREWLSSAEPLALALNAQTNNSSLVLAFELGRGGKVLLFAADAQRGNWVSWADAEWRDGDRTVTARDLLARTVLYKVGHHCSHNATLNGDAASPHPSLGWMAAGGHGREFTAMITAVERWARGTAGWDHPRPAIRDALLRKASGRVFQTDIDEGDMHQPAGTPPAEWNRFRRQLRGSALYFDHDVAP